MGVGRQCTSAQRQQGQQGLRVNPDLGVPTFCILLQNREVCSPRWEAKKVMMGNVRRKATF